jgi:hypothetical protein
MARPVASALLQWADQVYAEGQPDDASDCIKELNLEAATEFGEALRTWTEAPGWKPFGQHLILSGGTGIGFLASSDGVIEQSFVAATEACLPVGCRVERSRLHRAAERESYIFLLQPNGGDRICEVRR